MLYMVLFRELEFFALCKLGKVIYIMVNVFIRILSIWIYAAKLDDVLIIVISFLCYFKWYRSFCQFGSCKIEQPHNKRYHKIKSYI